MTNGVSVARYRSVVSPITKIWSSLTNSTPLDNSAGELIDPAVTFGDKRLEGLLPPRSVAVSAAVPLVPGDPADTLVDTSSAATYCSDASEYITLRDMQVTLNERGLFVDGRLLTRSPLVNWCWTVTSTGGFCETKMIPGLTYLCREFSLGVAGKCSGTPPMITVKPVVYSGKVCICVLIGLRGGVRASHAAKKAPKPVAADRAPDVPKCVDPSYPDGLLVCDVSAASVAIEFKRAISEFLKRRRSREIIETAISDCPDADDEGGVDASNIIEMAERLVDDATEYASAVYGIPIDRTWTRSMKELECTTLISDCEAAVRVRSGAASRRSRKPRRWTKVRLDAPSGGAGAADSDDEYFDAAEESNPKFPFMYIGDCGYPGFFVDVPPDAVTCSDIYETEFVVDDTTSVKVVSNLADRDVPTRAVQDYLRWVTGNHRFGERTYPVLTPDPISVSRNGRTFMSDYRVKTSDQFSLEYCALHSRSLARTKPMPGPSSKHLFWEEGKPGWEHRHLILLAEDNETEIAWLGWVKRPVAERIWESHRFKDRIVAVTATRLGLKGGMEVAIDAAGALARDAARDMVGAAAAGATQAAMDRFRDVAMAAPDSVATLLAPSARQPIRGVTDAQGVWRPVPSEPVIDTAAADGGVRGMGGRPHDPDGATEPAGTGPGGAPEPGPPDGGGDAVGGAGGGGTALGNRYSGTVDRGMNVGELVIGSAIPGNTHSLVIEVSKATGLARRSNFIETIDYKGDPVAALRYLRDTYYQCLRSSHTVCPLGHLPLLNGERLGHVNDTNGLYLTGMDHDMSQPGDAKLKDRRIFRQGLGSNVTFSSGTFGVGTAGTSTLGVSGYERLVSSLPPPNWYVMIPAVRALLEMSRSPLDPMNPYVKSVQGSTSNNISSNALLMLMFGSIERGAAVIGLSGCSQLALFFNALQHIVHVPRLPGGNGSAITGAGFIGRIQPIPLTDATTLPTKTAQYYHLTAGLFNTIACAMGKLPGTGGVLNAEMLSLGQLMLGGAAHVIYLPEGYTQDDVAAGFAMVLGDSITTYYEKTGLGRQTNYDGTAAAIVEYAAAMGLVFGTDSVTEVVVFVSGGFTVPVGNYQTLGTELDIPTRDGNGALLTYVFPAPQADPTVAPAPWYMSNQVFSQMMDYYRNAPSATKMPATMDYAADARREVMATRLLAGISRICAPDARDVELALAIVHHAHNAYDEEYRYIEHFDSAHPNGVGLVSSFWPKDVATAVVTDSITLDPVPARGTMSMPAEGTWNTTLSVWGPCAFAMNSRKRITGEPVVLNYPNTPYTAGAVYNWIPEVVQQSIPTITCYSTNRMWPMLSTFVFQAEDPGGGPAVPGTALPVSALTFAFRMAKASAVGSLLVAVASKVFPTTGQLDPGTPDLVYDLGDPIFDVNDFVCWNFANANFGNEISEAWRSVAMQDLANMTAWKAFMCGATIGSPGMLGEPGTPMQVRYNLGFSFVTVTCSLIQGSLALPGGTDVVLPSHNIGRWFGDYGAATHVLEAFSSNSAIPLSQLKRTFPDASWSGIPGAALLVERPMLGLDGWAREFSDYCPSLLIASMPLIPPQTNGKQVGVVRPFNGLKFFYSDSTSRWAASPALLVTLSSVVPTVEAINSMKAIYGVMVCSPHLSDATQGPTNVIPYVFQSMTWLTDETVYVAMSTVRKPLSSDSAARAWFSDIPSLGVNTAADGIVGGAEPLVDVAAMLPGLTFARVPRRAYLVGGGATGRR